MNSRKTVGFVVSGIMDEFTEQLCRGIIDEAREDDVNIIVIPVKYIDREMKDIPDVYEFQYETNVTSITNHNIDVLIVAADCIGCLTTEENLLSFMDSLRQTGIPIILAASKIDGYPGVVFDNKSGMIDGITYLVKNCGAKNICMITSQEHNADVSERYEAFLEMMDYYHLPIGPKAVMKTYLSSDCKEECLELLDNNPDADAIICVNDAIALGLYKAMEDRGLVPGEDIMVMGFDNSIGGSLVTPSLTTVDASAVTLGRRVFAMARRRLEGWNVSSMTVPTAFIQRDSFGSIFGTESSDEDFLNKNLLDSFFHRIFYKMDDVSEIENFEILIQFKSMMNIIIDYINSQEYNPERVVFLKSKVEELFKTDAYKYTDVDVLMAYVNRIRIAAVNRFQTYERRCQAFETFAAILEKLIHYVHSDASEYKNVMDASMLSIKYMVEDTLNFDSGGDESYACIANNLKGFGVDNAYIYIYDQPIIHRYGYDFDMPDTINLKVAMTDGMVICVPKNEQRTDFDNIYDNRYITRNKMNMVQMPLYFREKVYGFILYDLNEASFRNGDFLASQYSTAARIIDILR